MSKPSTTNFVNYVKTQCIKFDHKTDNGLELWKLLKEKVESRYTSPTNCTINIKSLKAPLTPERMKEVNIRKTIEQGWKSKNKNIPKAELNNHYLNQILYISSYRKDGNTYKSADLAQILFNWYRYVIFNNDETKPYTMFIKIGYVNSTLKF